MRGIVNFPAQDTLYPAGYEVPFANAFYAWDAALAYTAAKAATRRAPESPRAAPTRLVGSEIETYNALLASARVDADAAIVSLPSAYDERGLTNADIATLAERTMSAQRFCRRARLTCELVDLRYDALARLRGFPLVIVPLPESGPLRGRRFVPAATALLGAYRRSRGTAVLQTATPSPAALAAALRRARHTRYVEGADATFAEDPQSGAGFLSLVDYDPVPHIYANVTIRSRGGKRYAFAKLAIAARSGILLPFEIPLRRYNPRFEGDDRISASCPIARIVTEPPSARKPNATRTEFGATSVEFQLAPNATACRFEGRIAGTPRSYAVPAGATQITLSQTGRFALLAPHSRVEPAPLASETRETDSAKAVNAANAANAGTLPIRSDLLAYEAPQPRFSANAARAYAEDVYRDGEGAIVLENDRVRIVAAPNAGGRAFIFEDRLRHTNAFTTVGALRDDVLIAPPLSQVDKIAKYTNQMPAGFFNRAYHTRVLASGPRAVVRFSYVAPDAYPHGAHFERTLALEPHARCFTADLTNRFYARDRVIGDTGTSGPAALRERAGLARQQRAVSVTSLAVGDLRVPSAWLITSDARHLATFAGATLPVRQHALGLFAPGSGELALVAWPASAQPVTAIGRTNSLLVRIAQAPGTTTRLAFAYERARTTREALARTQAFARAGCGAGEP